MYNIYMHTNKIDEKFTKSIDSIFYLEYYKEKKGGKGDDEKQSASLI